MISWDKIIHATPFILLVVLFIVAIWAQRQSCDGDVFRGIAAFPRLFVPTTNRAWLRG